ncbi:hypothetical protein Ahy_A02g005659 [Arachis hypogaea]|uniref:Uncharacterized protein n=1 Tax=Arachis hypogaea TaxID=3818 RepID=A0A445E7W2_ARAHY|nr:hypothetical protein Ahy_A02g005659 [Arachis hypogaea]
MCNGSAAVLPPSVLSAPSVAWPSLVARRPAFLSSVRPPWLSLFCWLGATCCRIAARRRLPGSRRLPGRRPCLHRRHTSPISRCCFSASGNNIASASLDGTVSVLDIKCSHVEPIFVSAAASGGYL